MIRIKYDQENNEITDFRINIVFSLSNLKFKYTIFMYILLRKRYDRTSWKIYSTLFFFFFNKP